MRRTTLHEQGERKAPLIIITECEEDQHQTLIFFVHCLQLLSELPDESINMIITSPPYADQIKDYGEKVRKIKPEQYVEWFLPRAKEFYRVLSSNRSFFLNISDKLDGKFQSLYVFKLVISLCDNIGFHLVRDYIWYNPARETAKNKLKEIAARLNEIVGQLDA